MDNRSWLTGASGAPPAAPSNPSVGYPKNGNPMTGDPATQGGAWWFHQIGEELRAIQVAAGIEPSTDNTAQLLAAILSITQKAGDARHPVYAGDAANANDMLSVTFATQITALYDGMEVTTDVAIANATTTPTFNLTLGETATGDKLVLNHDGTEVAIGSIHGRVTLGWVPTSDAWVLLNTSSVMNQAQADARYAALAGLSTQAFSVATATLAAHAARLSQVQAAESAAIDAAAADATAKANAAQAAAIDAGFGVGQSVVDVTASRSLGVTYTNTTGKSITVYLVGAAAAQGSCGFRFFVGSLCVAVLDSASPGYVNAGATVVVPNGSSYRIDGTGTYATNLPVPYGWRELR